MRLPWLSVVKLILIGCELPIGLISIALSSRGTMKLSELVVLLPGITNRWVINE